MAYRTTLSDLATIGSDEGWADAWLEHAVQELGCLRSGLLVVDRDDTGQLSPAAHWPLEITGTEQLGDLIEESIQGKASVILPSGGDGRFLIAYPVYNATRLRAVFAAELLLPSGESLEQMMSKVEWLCLWLEGFFARLSSDSKQRLLERQNVTLDGYLSVNQAESWDEAALQWVDGLTREFGCERVSLGVVRKSLVGQLIISGSSDHELKTVVVKAIKAAMQESCDQNAMLSWPPLAETGHIAQNTEKLTAVNNGAQVLTIPLARDDELIFVVLLERAAERPFTQSEAEFIDSTLSLVSLSLAVKQRADYGFLQSTAALARQQLERLFAAGYTTRKLVVLGLAFLILFFSFATGTYRVTGDVELAPQTIRVMSAPFEGFIRRASVRAGNQVSSGDELAAMEDRELRLEKIKWISQVAQDEKQYNEAIASYDRAEANVFSAKVAQSKAQLELVETKLERAIVRAPFDALIVSGDLSKRVGGSVNQGEELFQISPLNAYRLIIFVSEYKIRDVQTGQAGRVVFSSLTNRDYPFTVENVTPVTTVRDGGTFYRVEAAIEDPDADLRPGLVGVAKIDVESRLLIDNWTHDIRRWLRLKLWSFWG